MSFIQFYGKEIVALLVPIITFLLSTLFRPRAKLIYSTLRSFTYLIQEPLRDQAGSILKTTQTVNTVSQVIHNVGKEKATNVEAVFNWEPKHINLWPIRHYEMKVDKDQRHILVFPSLAPNEYVGFELLAINVDVPPLINVRCDECTAQFVAMAPQPIVSQWKRRIGVFLMLAGLGLTVYLGVVLIQLLVLLTPVGRV